MSAVPAPAIASTRVPVQFWRTGAGFTILRVVIVVLFLMLWEFASGRFISKFWVSSPSAIFAVFQRWILDGSLWMHLGATLKAIAAGYVIGSALGILLGLVLGFMPRVQRVLVPFLSAFYSIPKIALAPLFVILLGIGIESKICLVAVTVFFLLLFATMDGMRDIDEDLVESLQIMGATPTEIATKLVIPAAKPWIFTGMRISVRYAMTAAILGEVIASNQGIGFLIEYNSGQFNAAGVFAAVVLLVLFGVAVTEFLTRFERGSAVEKLPF